MVESVRVQNHGHDVEFLVFELLSNGVYFPCVVRIIDGTTVFRGKLYRG